MLHIRRERPVVMFGASNDQKLVTLVLALMAPEIRPKAMDVITAVRASNSALELKINGTWSVARMHHGDKGVMITFIAQTGRMNREGLASLVMAAAGIADVIVSKDPRVQQNTP